MSMINENQGKGLGLFERYLTIWVVLCMAVAISLFGPTSPVALATIVGVLVEVPVMLILVKIANQTKHWFPKTTIELDNKK